MRTASVLEFDSSVETLQQAVSQTHDDMDISVGERGGGSEKLITMLMGRRIQVHKLSGIRCIR